MAGKVAGQMSVSGWLLVAVGCRITWRAAENGPEQDGDATKQRAPGKDANDCEERQIEIADPVNPVNYPEHETDQPANATGPNEDDLFRVRSIHE
jgi:hypothetical protein